jgi:hypothetical protein
VLRAAATNLMTLQDDGTSIVDAIRLIAASAKELSQRLEDKEQALKLIDKIEEKWASIDDLVLLTIQPNEVKECEQLVAESMILKSDIYSSKLDQIQERSQQAINALLNPELKRIMLKNKAPLLVLASKVIYIIYIYIYFFAEVNLPTPPPLLFFFQTFFSRRSNLDKSC